MQQDFSTIRFNPDHKMQSAAREAAIGLRYVLASLALNVLAVVVGAVAGATAVDGVSLFTLPAVASAVLAFVFGAYGIYSMMDALGWSGAVSIVVIIGTLVPYAKLIVLIVVIVLALSLIRKSGFRFSLSGKLRRKQGPPPLPEA